MVLAVAFSLVMLGLGGFGGFINMSYAMNSMIHNTSWVTAHFHLIFGGAVVIMYFAIAYEMWPRITGKPLRSKGLAHWQLWLWFWGMLITTIPWHIAGLMGQPRRVAEFDYSIPFVARTAVLVDISVIGGLILLSSAILFIIVLVRSHVGERTVIVPLQYALAVNPPARVPAALNGFALWNSDPAGTDARRLRLSDCPIPVCPRTSFGSGLRRDPWTRQRAEPAMTEGPFSLAHPWRRAAWATLAVILGISLVLGFIVLSRYQQNGEPLGAWAAICRGLGIAPDVGPASAPQPPLRTPTLVAWTGGTLDQIAAGNAEDGAFVALNCTACHGEGGVAHRTSFRPSPAWIPR